ncbi:MAG: hypothetical protein FWC38_08275 [Proteobacteria bacterium]|nr:hypothetical protein [Pseudomonadota bacterium]
MGCISEVRGQVSEVRHQRSGIRGQVSEVRYQRSGIRGQVSEVRGRDSVILRGAKRRRRIQPSPLVGEGGRRQGEGEKPSFRYSPQKKANPRRLRRHPL